MTEESNVGSSVEDPKEQTVSTDIPKTDETIEMTDENEDEGGHDENTAESAEGGTSTHGLNPILTSSGKKRPPFKYNPGKVTLRFIFANRDGLTVTLECNHADTVGEVKGALLSVWPEELPNCSGGDKLRLICMGRGILMPDTRSLEDCQVPVFKTHPTPVNVSVKPESTHPSAVKPPRSHVNQSANNASSDSAGSHAVSQGCSCVLL